MLVFCLFLYLVAGVSGQGFSTTFLQNALFGGENSDFGVASYTDQARGIRYVVGQTYSTEFYGLSPLESSKEGGAPNVLIVALNQDSDSLLWFKIIGTSRSDQPRGITGDTQGNIWITGTTFGTFDDNETDGVSRGFVIKMDSNGSVLSSSTFNSCQPTSVVSDSNNNIWVVGSVANTKDSDEAALNEDVAVVLFSAETGKEIITETFGGSASDIAKIVVAGKNTISVGGTTQSSDFPFTLGTRECELCSSVGFIMTLDYDAEIGIQQKFSTYIAGKEYESLSVVSITYDSVDNMYLAIYDDANSMGSFIQQIKRDRSMGWTSEKSDAFWKVEYLPLINALYTIGTFSTPSDYTTFFVLDTKTGSSLYSSKALTGSLVDASVHNTEHGSIKINMVGTLTKEHRIASHGRTYITGHKTDDILLVSMVIHPLKHGSSKPAQVARGIEARDNVVASQCLWLHQNGFSSVNDLTTTYNVSGSAIVLPWEAGHADYDLEHASTLVKIVPATSLKPVRLPAGQWGTSYESYFRFGYNKGTTIPKGLTYVEYDVITAGIAKLIVSRTDSVAWTIKLQIISTNEMFTATLPTTVDAVVSVWVSYDGNSMTTADNIKVYASTDGTKPTVPAIKYTTTSAQNTDWTNQNLVPALYSGSTTETLLIQSYICGINEVIKTIPIALSEVLPITGTTSFPAAGSGSVAYVAQVVIPSADSIEGTQTKFTILKANGEPYNSSMVFVYEKEYELGPEHLRKQYGEGFFASTSISGTGTLAGWVFPSTKKFIAGKRYYFYIASGLTDSDNLGTNNGGSKRDIESRDNSAPFLLYNSSTKKYEEVPGVKLVSAVTSKPLVADPLAQFDPPPPPPAPGTPPPPSDTGSGRGDPWFIGYNGQKFEFDGHAGGIYNLYNDQWVNVNSLFGYANEKKHRGTVMHAIGVSIGEHKLLMDITNRENKKIFDVVLDGKLTKIGYQVHHLTGCVDIQYNSKVILISTPRHSIRLTIQWGKNGHISENYFDIDIHHPEEDVTKIGGVLGQTAHEGVDDIDTLEEDFEISDIFSFEKSKFYNLQSIDC